MLFLDMRLNYKKSTHVIVNNCSIAAQYWFTKDDIAGQAPGSRRVWAIINFCHPETKLPVKLRVSELQNILDATHREIEKFVEGEIDCYINHCDEHEDAPEKSRMALSYQ